jgi:hypothetical protein
MSDCEAGVAAACVAVTKTCCHTSNAIKEMVCSDVLYGVLDALQQPAEQATTPEKHTCQSCDYALTILFGKVKTKTTQYASTREGQHSMRRRGKVLRTWVVEYLVY